MQSQDTHTHVWIVRYDEGEAFGEKYEIYSLFRKLWEKLWEYHEL